MRKKINKKCAGGFFLLLAILLSSFNAYAGPLEIFTSSKGITPSQSAVMISDLRTGEVMIQYNIDKPLIPASIMKSVTVAGLLSHTGPSYRYVTDVLTTGPAVNGVLGGDIVVIGSGDPSLNSRHLMAGGDIVSDIVKALKSKGVKRIKGKIRVDESIWSGPSTCPSWGTGDLAQAYGTGQHGLNFQDNANGGKSVANPAGVFTGKLKSELSAAGIVLENGDMPESKRLLLVSHESVPVDEIMRSCMMRSDNQYAEAMLRTIAALEDRPGSTVEGARLNSEFWTSRRAPMSGVNITDGSGLSRQNKVTAAFMTHVLKTMWLDPYYVSFFPLAGVEGTLRKFLAGTRLESYIAMKTGSMTGVQCYAGYKLNDDYEPTHTIVVIMNQLVNRDVARKSVEDMLLSVFR